MELRTEIGTILSELDGSRTEWLKAVRNAAYFFQTRKAYLANLFLHTSGYEFFITYMQETNFVSLKGIAESVQGNTPVDAMTVRYL